MQNGERELQRQRKREIKSEMERTRHGGRIILSVRLIMEIIIIIITINITIIITIIGTLVVIFFLTLMSDYIWQGCEPYRRSGTNWSDDGERPLTLQVIHSNLKRPTPVLHPPISSFLFSFRRVASSKASSKALHITGTMPVPVRGRGIWITAWIGSAEERLSDYRLARSMA